MAANVNALQAQNQQLTGHEGADNEAKLLQELRSIVAGAQGGSPAVDGTPQTGPLKLKLPNAEGNLVEYTFENMEQLNAGLAQTLNNVRTTIAELQANQGQAVTSAPSVEKPAGFDKEEFVRIAGEDPQAGINYILQHGVLGGQGADAFGTLKQTINDVRDIKERLSVFQFREAHPEVGGPQVGPTLDKIREELGLSRDNPAAWEASLAVARERGILPTRQQLAAYQQQQAAQQQQYAPVHSPIGRSYGGAYGGGDINPELANLAEGMDADTLEKFLRAKGMMS